MELSVPGYEINPTSIYIQDAHTVRMYNLRLNLTSGQTPDDHENNNINVLAAPNLDQGEALMTVVWDADYPDVLFSVSTPFGCSVSPVNRACVWAESSSASMTVSDGYLSVVNGVDAAWTDNAHTGAYKSVYVRSMMSGDYGMYVSRLGDGGRRIMRTRATVMVFLPGVCMCVCVYVCIYVSIYMYTYTQIIPSTHTKSEGAVKLCIHTYIHTYMFTYIHVFMHTGGFKHTSEICKSSQTMHT